MSEAVVVLVVALLAALLIHALIRQRQARRWAPMFDHLGREVRVYAFGLADKRTGRVEQVKFGVTARTFDVRAREIADPDGEAQVPYRTHEIVTLAYGPGGVQRERDLHHRCAATRYPRSEWFGVSAQVVACVAELERVTSVGRKFLADYTRRGTRWRIR